MTPATIELVLAALKLGIAAYNQVQLMDLDELPPEIKDMLIAERDRLGQEIMRLDGLGSP